VVGKQKKHYRPEIELVKKHEKKNEDEMLGMNLGRTD